MRAVAKFVLLLGLLVAGGVAAAEQGVVIRAGELKAQPFIDAATTEKVTANQSVTIVKRQGGWVQVESNGKTGWLRTLNLKLNTGSVPRFTSPPGKGLAKADPAPGAPGASGAAGQRGNAGGRGKGVPKGGLASLLQTGSSGKTETTGVKGLGEEDIKNAVMDPAQLALLATLAVAPADATSNAQQSGLKESSVDYLKAGR